MKYNKCKKCTHWVFTTTLGSMEIPIWHCRHGFTPNKDCYAMAEYNIQCKKRYYKEHPEELQYKIKF